MIASPPTKPSGPSPGRASGAPGALGRPPFWKPRVRAMTIAFIAYVALHVAVLSLPTRVWSSWVGVSSQWRFVVWLPYPLVMVWFIRSMNAGDRSTRRRVAAGELPCWRCGYDLSAAEGGPVCPECGEAFDADELRERWAGLFGVPAGRASGTIGPSGPGAAAT